MPDATRTAGSFPTIAVRCEQPGVVLTVDGRLDERAADLLGEVVRAALLAVRRASRIHIDLSRAEPVPAGLPRVLRQLERAGATITRSRRSAAVTGWAG